MRVDATRLIRVSRILSKHTFAYLFYDLLFRRKERALAARVRKLLEDLGPIYVKFGQAVSTRPELLPPAFLREFKRLQDRVKPFPDEEARQIIEEDLGKPGELFEELDKAPRASASLAQVYHGILHDGTEVAVKVRRPGIRDTLTQDLTLLYRLARGVERLASTARKIRMEKAVRQFELLITKELDFVNERNNLGKARDSVEPEWGITIPKPFPDLCSHRVLTLEWLDGIKVADKDQLIRQGYHAGELASHIGQAYLQQILKSGVFHADPHPGNILILGENEIGLVDFGTLGELDRTERRQLRRLLLSAAQKDGQEIARSLAEAGIINKNQIEYLEEELEIMMHKHYRDRLEEIKMGRLLYEVLNRIVRQMEINLPASYLNLSRTAILVENVCEELDPNYRWPETLEKVYTSDLIVEETISDFRGQLWESFRILSNLPQKVDRVLDTLETGQLGTPTREELEELIEGFSPLAASAGPGFLLGALIICTTLLWLSGATTLSLIGASLSGVGLLAFVRTLLIA
ncbi:MAG: ABC1 kinase family protein [Candidatus Acetothermia bacterium]